VNLAGRWPPLPPIDVILLRNVMIYFDLETKRSVLAKVRRVLRPDGFLVLGSAETTINVDDAFERGKFGAANCYRIHLPRPGEGAGHRFGKTVSRPNVRGD